jgi:hypothetical protein
MTGKINDKDKALENWEKKADKLAAGKEVAVKKTVSYSLPEKVISKLKIHSATIGKDQSRIITELLEEYFKKNSI